MQYRFGSLVLNTSRLTLVRSGERVDVEPRVLRFLIYLIENRDRVVSRTELFDRTFSRQVVTDNALTVRVRAARAAVGDTASAQRFIATVQGEGYRFVADVETTQPRLGNADVSARVMSGESTIASGPPSIAVLPFELLADGADNSMIARGLTHDVITRIGCSRSLFVIARGTAFQYRSGQEDVRAVGEALGARYLCQGAVQVVGRKVRVTVSLAVASSRQEIWSDCYDRPLDDVLSLQEAIAMTVVSELEHEVQRHEMRDASLQPATRLDAWSAYHGGLNHMYRFRTSDCDRAEKYFRQALDLEPGLARPYAGLSFVNYERAYLDLDETRERALATAQAQALRAVDADPADPMGHWALSRTCFLGGELDAAQRSVARATELNPSYATAQYFQGWIAMLLGDRQSCRQRIELALRLSPKDPLSYGMQGISALNLALMGEHEAALERTRAALEHPDVHYQAQVVAAIIFSLGGSLMEARAMMRKVRATRPGYGLADFFAANPFAERSDVQALSAAYRALGSVG
ncbi:MAG: winged helix-turn-helix domain-containing protein [Pseudomonadota bacterium]